MSLNSLTSDISKASELLKNGGIGIVPTETVYGLAANALDPLVCAKIFQAKQRPHFDPLIVHIYSLKQVFELTQCTDDQKEYVHFLAQEYWPGPLTLVLPKSLKIPPIVTSGLPNLAIRMPQHPLMIELLKTCKLPLAAPSANMFGQLSPTRAEHLSKDLLASIDFVLDGGPCEVGVESSILDLSDLNDIKLLRPGGLSKELLENTLEQKITQSHSSIAINAPGQLESHYAPRTPLFIQKALKTNDQNSKAALLTFKPLSEAEKYNLQYNHYEHLSQTGQLIEAASSLFDKLHQLDQLSIQEIHVEALPLKGLGLAIMDRLQRASFKS